MKIEHAAYQVADPTGVAAWYVAHLGMTVKRSQRESPFMHFLADSAGAVMIEFYNNPAVAVPDYRAVNPVLMHVAFRTDDVAGVRARLLAAGASAEGEVDDQSGRRSSRHAAGSLGLSRSTGPKAAPHARLRHHLGRRVRQPAGISRARRLAASVAGRTRVTKDRRLTRRRGECRRPGWNAADGRSHWARAHATPTH